MIKEHYYWDLRMTRVANRYKKLTWPAALNRIQYHNQSLYKNPFNQFYWDKEDNQYKMYVNGDLIATLDLVEKIEDLENTYMWYRE